MPLFAFSLGRQYLEFEANVAQAGRDQLVQARSMAVAIERELRARIVVLEFLARSRSLLAGDMDGFRAQAEAVVTQRLPGAIVVLLREDGQHIVNTAMPPGASLPVRQNRETLREVFVTGRPAVSDLYLGIVARRPVVSIDVPVKDADGRVIYVLSINPDLDAFADVVRRYGPTESRVISVFDRQGVNVTRTRNPERFVGQKAGPELLPRLLSEREGSFEGVSRDGIPLVAAFSHSELFGWAVAIGVPRAELTAPAIASAMRTLAAGGALLVVSLAFSVLVARRIAGPITNLRNLATAVDDDASPLPPRTGLRETDDVAQALSAARMRRQSSERRYQALFDANPNAIGVYDPETLRIVEVNEAAVRQYGWSREEFLTMTMADLRSPEETSRLRETLPTLTLGAVRPADRTQHRRKDGTLIDIEASSRLIELDGRRFVLALAQDVTEQNLTRVRLAEAIEAFPGSFRLYDRNERLVLTNDVNRLLAGADRPKPTVGDTFESIARTTADHEVAAAAVGRKEEWLRERLAQFRRGDTDTDEHWRDGRWFHLLERRTSDGGTISLRLDITARKAVEAQLRHAQKMEAVGQLTGGIAHDFNNILMVILANADALQEEENLDAGALAERLEQISQAVLRASELTRQLLTFSRKQALSPRRTDLNDLVSGTGTLLRRALGEHIEIDAVLADGLWTVNVDRAQFETALVNLCVNARDAMPGGGRLLIETRNVALEATDVAAGDYAMLSVTDTGSGMPPETVARVFEPFFTTKEVGKGTGLGLSMVYGFIKQSNGHITIHSEVGRGTRFTLYLPRSDGVTEEAAAPRTASLPRGTERILVVEDEPQVRASIVQQLQSLGYVVAQVSDGAAGLASFQAAALPYDLLITDVVMPGPLSGKALADEVTHRWPKTRIVFMSGYTDNVVLHDGKADGAVLLLSKPFRKGDLARILRQALDDAPDPDHAIPEAV